MSPELFQAKLGDEARWSGALVSARQVFASSTLICLLLEGIANIAMVFSFTVFFHGSPFTIVAGRSWDLISRTS